VLSKESRYLPTAMAVCCSCLPSGMQVLVAMHRWRKARLFSHLGALAFICLASCVFIWGLQYKLSLYDPPESATHHIPMAKLLSKNEQSNATESPQVVRTRTSTEIIYTASNFVFFILLLTLSALNPRLSGQRMSRASQFVHRLRSPHLETYFVRPPPVFA